MSAGVVAGGPPSARSIYALVSPDSATATRWGPGGIAASSTTSPRWGSTRSGSRRSSGRRWPTSATTSPTTATSTRCSARWPTFDALVADGARPRASSVVLDLVPNHSSRPAPVVPRVAPLLGDDPQARLVRLAGPAPDGGPPNNWSRRLRRRQPARGRWTRPRGQYYLHLFLREQPDLNWANPEVDAAMHDVLRFWMDRGVDGFRADGVPLHRQGPRAPRDQAERLAPPPQRGLGHASTTRLRGIRKVVDEYEDRMIVGRWRCTTCTASSPTSSTATSSTSRTTSSSSTRRGSARGLPGDSIADFERISPEDTAWPAWFLANHDNPRPRMPLRPRRPRRPARAGDPRDALRAPRHAVHLPGRELGLPDATIPPERRRGRRRPRPGARPDPVDARGPGHGFTDGADAWPVRRRRRAPQRADPGRRPDSTLNLTKALARLRPQLTGDQELFDAGPGHRGLDARRHLPGRESTSPTRRCCADPHEARERGLRGAFTTRPLGSVAGTLVISSDPSREDGERLARTERGAHPAA